MEYESRDITIIGGGPAGLFALFYAGMRGVSAQIVDALPEPGGQLTALYPEKYIFDVAGFTKVLTKDLVRSCVEQAVQFGGPIHCNQRVSALEEADGRFVLVTETDRFATRAVVVAAGVGAFSPRRLPQACAAPWYGRGIFDRVTEPAEFAGRRVVIIGGGDSAFDWAHQLRDIAASVVLVHRSDRFRAHAATVAQVQSAAAAGKTTLYAFHELHDIVSENDAIVAVDLKDIKAKSTRRIAADVVLPMLGFVSDIGPLAAWGLTVEKDEIVVNSQMETGRRGVWAAGDITTYPGKLKLIVTGFGEAAAAVNQAVHYLHPDKKVNPGHSSNMAIFGQKDD
ncbi:MAG: NAD(P)/FAD-dependent oxidoreductase [Gemmatimonadales bacterium]